MRFPILQVVLVFNVGVQELTADTDFTSLLQMPKNAVTRRTDPLQWTDHDIASTKGAGRILKSAFAKAAKKMKGPPWRTPSIKPGSIGPGDRLNCAINTVSAPYVYMNPYERTSVNIHPSGPCSNPAACANGDPYVLMEKASLTRVGPDVNIALDEQGSGTWLPYMEDHASLAWASPGDKWMGVGPLTRPCKVALFKHTIDNPNDWPLHWSPMSDASMLMNKREEKFRKMEWKNGHLQGHALLNAAAQNARKLTMGLEALKLNRSIAVGILITPTDTTPRAMEEYAEFSGEVSPLHEADIVPLTQIDYIPYKADPGPQNNTLASFVFVDLENMFNSNLPYPYLLHRIDVHHRDQSFGSGEVFGAKMV